MSNSPSPADVRRDAIVNSACEQIRALMESHFRDIQKAAEDSFIGDDAKTEPVCVVSVKIEFGALAAATKVAVKLGWSARYADESEEEVDPLQSKLGLPDIEPGARNIVGSKKVSP